MLTKFQEGDSVRLSKGVAEMLQILPFNIAQVTDNGHFRCVFMHGESVKDEIFTEDQLELVHKK